MFTTLLYGHQESHHSPSSHTHVWSQWTVGWGPVGCLVPDLGHWQHEAVTAWQIEGGRAKDCPPRSTSPMFLVVPSFLHAILSLSPMALPCVPLCPPVSPLCQCLTRLRPTVLWGGGEGRWTSLENLPSTLGFCLLTDLLYSPLTSRR